MRKYNIIYRNTNRINTRSKKFNPEMSRSGIKFSTPKQIILKNYNWRPRTLLLNSEQLEQNQGVEESLANCSNTIPSWFIAWRRSACNQNILNYIRIKIVYHCCGWVIINNLNAIEVVTCDRKSSLILSLN